MSIYQPATIHGENARSVIDEAYAFAGLTPPTNVDAISEAISSEPDPHAVAVAYATRALDKNQDPAELVAEAITSIQRAQALEQFRDIYHRVVDSIALERIDEKRTQAVKDLSPAFNREIKNLVKASGQLDKSNPLDRDTAFNTDTTAAWKTATGILETLHRYQIAPINRGDVPAPLASILGIVTIPDVDMEEADFNVGGVLVDAGQPGYAERNQIRTLVSAVNTDRDRALVNIARGKWSHISFELADTEEADRRITAAHNALTRTQREARNTAMLKQILVGN